MTQVGSVYGEALYALSREEALSDDLLKQLNVLRTSFESEPDFVQLLSAPNVSKQERCQLLDNCFRGKVAPYLLNFLKILTEKGYMRHFSSCVEAYQKLYNQDNGILSVTAVTAVALTGEQAVRLTEALNHLTGKRIALMNRLDPTVLGGMRLYYDGKCLDDTISHRLDSVRSWLKNTVL